MKKRLSILFAIASLQLGNAQAQSPKEKGLEAITENSVSAIITHLSSDWMEGREAGRAGAYRAAEYIASIYEFMGLEPAGDIVDGKATYFQNFDILEYKADERQALSVWTEEKEFSFANHTDFEVKAAPISLKGHAELVFVGYGLQVDSLNYNDLANEKALDGKIWVRLKGAPTEGRLANAFQELPAKQLHLLKADLAKKKGALSIIEIDPNAHLNTQAANLPFRDNRKYYEGDKPLSSFYETRFHSPISDTNYDVPVFMGGNTLASTLIAQTEIETYKKGLESTKKQQVQKITLKADKASFEANAIVERIRVRNVLAKITGATQADSLVAIGAHYDHLGKREGYIWNGADDNASGVAAVLNIAKAVKATGIQPNKTILFASWTAEEKGLHGSKHFVRSFDKPQNINIYLNFDMVGRRGDWHSKDNQVSFIYTAEKADFWSVNAQNIKKYNIDLEMFDGRTPKGHAGGSDNVIFDEAGIPYFWYHTGGHEDYHQVSDHSDKIMMDKAANISKLSFLNIWDWANN